MTQITLRAARSTDAGKLGEMITQAVAARDWKPRLHSAAEDIAHAGQMIDRDWVTVAETDHNDILGFIAREGDYVHALFVTPPAQGKGIGAALLDRAKANTGRLDLWTFQANTGAQRFYKRHGFTVDKTTDGAGNEEGLPDVHLLWSAPCDAPKSPAPAAAKPKDAPND